MQTHAARPDQSEGHIAPPSADVVDDVLQIPHRDAGRMRRVLPASERGGDHRQSQVGQSARYRGVGVPVVEGEYSSMDEEHRRPYFVGGAGQVNLDWDEEVVALDGAWHG